MIQKYIPRITLIILGALIVLGAVNALAASNTFVSNTYLQEQSTPIAVNDKKPSACSALILTAIIQCPSLGGVCNGGDASELILGSQFIDNIQGGKGNDCILGGGGDDNMRGNQGTDVCIGGPDNDTFQNTGCETEIQ